MTTFRNWLACFVLILGAVVTFGLVIGAAWFLLGIGAAVFFGFASICALATALDRAFAEDKPEYEDGWGEVCAPEGLNVIPLQGKVR